MPCNGYMGKGMSTVVGRLKNSNARFLRLSTIVVRTLQVNSRLLCLIFKVDSGRTLPTAVEHYRQHRFAINGVSGNAI